MSVFDYCRRHSSTVNVGNTPLGGDSPIRVQSMASTSTLDTDGSVAQAERIINAGAEYLRFTAQGVREAENLGNIRAALRAKGLDTPLVADIHFNPRAAFASAKQVEKVRINPGNFVDPGRTFRSIEYTDEEYAAELERIEQALVPFLDTCRAHGTAIRIGVNHGSLSDRIMSRYGDTPAGMAESAMEFLRVCNRHGFHNVVISIKASNVTVMVETVRRMVRAMDAEDMHYPLHLGVTEAGDGEDGRIKSAVGIGALLAEGIGDTIRVSLSEDPASEIPVAKAIVDYIDMRRNAPSIDGHYAPDYNPVIPARRNPSLTPAVVGNGADAPYDADSRPDMFIDRNTDRFLIVDATEAAENPPAADPNQIIILTTDHINRSGRMLATLHALTEAGITNRIIPLLRYDGVDPDTARLRAAIDSGAILLAGFTDGIMIQSDALTEAESARLAFAILQSARLRFTRTEYIACPGCGRTLFDLRQTLAQVKAATSHLKNLKIGVMGCIVNGPGEMADADYGYVGAGAGRVSLYKGKVCVEKNIPEEEAVSRLIQLIKDNDDWK